MSTVVVVVASHRTGSSLVSSLLSRLGVAMGQPEQVSEVVVDDVWEDQEFVQIHREMFEEVDILGGHLAHKWRFPQPVIRPELTSKWLELARRRNSQPLWGFKDPRFPFVMDFGMGVLTGLGCNIKLVWLHRSLNAVARSLQMRDGSRFEESLMVATHQFKQWEAMKLRYADWPGCSLRYEDLLAEPNHQICVLADMLGIEPGAAKLSELVGMIGRPVAATFWNV